MSRCAGRPNEQTPWIMPYLMVKNVTDSMDFYEKAFNMKKGITANGEHEEPTHGELTYQGHLLMIGKEGVCDEISKCPATSGVESPITLYLYCENVDDFHQHAIKAGAQSLGAPENAFWGDRFCRLQCPNGYIWMFATHLTD